jgi:sarcosine oxidase, subunit delta
MLILECSYSGVHAEETELTPGYAAHLKRFGSGASDDDFNSYMFARKNPKGVHFELWRHAYGCGKWFIASQNKITPTAQGNHLPPLHVVVASNPSTERLQCQIHISQIRLPPKRPARIVMATPRERYHLQCPSIRRVDQALAQVQWSQSCSSSLPFWRPCSCTRAAPQIPPRLPSPLRMTMVRPSTRHLLHRMPHCPTQQRQLQQHRILQHRAPQHPMPQHRQMGQHLLFRQRHPRPDLRAITDTTVKGGHQPVSAFSYGGDGPC